MAESAVRSIALCCWCCCSPAAATPRAAPPNWVRRGAGPRGLVWRCWGMPGPCRLANELWGGTVIGREPRASAPELLSGFTALCRRRLRRLQARPPPSPHDGARPRAAALYRRPLRGAPAEWAPAASHQPGNRGEAGAGSWAECRVSSAGNRSTCSPSSLHLPLHPCSTTTTGGDWQHPGGDGGRRGGGRGGGAGGGGLQAVDRQQRRAPSDLPARHRREGWLVLGGRLLGAGLHSGSSRNALSCQRPTATRRSLPRPLLSLPPGARAQGAAGAPGDARHGQADCRGRVGHGRRVRLLRLLRGCGAVEGRS